MLTDGVSQAPLLQFVSTQDTASLGCCRTSTDRACIPLLGDARPRPSRSRGQLGLLLCSQIFCPLSVSAPRVLRSLTVNAEGLCLFSVLSVFTSHILNL